MLFLFPPFSLKINQKSPSYCPHHQDHPTTRTTFLFSVFPPSHYGRWTHQAPTQSQPVCIKPCSLKDFPARRFSSLLDHFNPQTDILKHQRILKTKPTLRLTYMSGDCPVFVSCHRRTQELLAGSSHFSHSTPVRLPTPTLPSRLLPVTKDFHIARSNDQPWSSLS